MVLVLHGHNQAVVALQMCINALQERSNAQLSKSSRIIHQNLIYEKNH